MQPPTPLLTLLTFPLLATAQMLAIIETNPTYYNSRNCYDGAKTYSIVDFGSSHAPSTGSSCTNRGTVRSIVRNASSGLDRSCADGKWTNGWKVCDLFGVPVVFDPSGRRMACGADNDVTIFNCPTDQPCWTNKKRKYKCTGSWY